MPFDIPPGLVWGIGVGSVVMFVGCLVLMPIIVVRIPEGYFDHEHRPRKPASGYHPALRITLKVLKNVVGVFFVLAGVAMLALPGQGLLTIFVGLMLVSFPGKYRFQKWVLRRGLERPINWLRKRRGRPPLAVHDPADD